MRLENTNFEEAIQKAVKEMGISEKRAASELMMFMCEGHGDTEQFKDYINYFIQNQDRFLNKKKEEDNNE